MLEGLDLGSCTSKWTVDYLSQVGGTKEVKIHVAAVAQMDFISKNFVYRYFLLWLLCGYNSLFKSLKTLLHHHIKTVLHFISSLCNRGITYFFLMSGLKDKNSEFT